MNDEFKIGLKTQVVDTQAKIQEQIDNITKNLQVDTSLAIDFSKSKSEINKSTKEIANIIKVQFNSMAKEFELPKITDSESLKYAKEYVSVMQKANSEAQKSAENAQYQKVLINVYKQSEEYIKSENEYLKERNRLLDVGKQQAKEYAESQKQIANMNQQISSGAVTTKTSKTTSDYSKIIPSSVSSNLTSDYQKLLSLSSQLNTNLEDSDKINVWNQYNDVLEKVNNQIKEISIDSNNLKASENQITSLSSNLSKFLTNTNISKKSKEQAQDWLKTISDGKYVSKNTFDSISNGLKQVTTKEREANSLGKNFFGTIKDGANSFFTWTIASTAVMSLKNAFGDMIDNVKELDKSLVELRKVSNLSESGVKSVTDQAYELGEKVAKTGTQVIDAITEFKRAGYDLDVSEDMAQAALITTNVAEGITDTADAAGMLISVLKGFKMADTDIMSIVDKLNQVSNLSPIGFDELADGLQRVSGTMNQAGNTIDQTLGLLTGGFAQLRNIEKVSTGMIFIQQRLRGVDEDGSAIEGLSAKLKDSFDKIGVSVENADGSLRSMYEIATDYAKVLPNLTSKQKQYYGELAAGSRQITVWNAITEQIADVEKATNQSVDSLGSSAQENGTYLDSIEGHMTSLQSNFQNLSRTIIDSELIKGGVSFLTGVTKGLIDISKVIGGGGVLGMAVAGLISTFGKTEKLRLFKTVADDSNMATSQVQIFGKSLTSISSALSTKFSSIKGNLFSNFSKSASEATINTEALNTSIETTTGASASATVAEEGQAATNIALGSTATAASIGVKALAVGCNMLAGMIIGIAISKLISVISNYKTASEKIEDALKDAKSKYSDVSSELDTLNSKLEENKTRIKEILALDNPTYVNKQELDNLQNANSLLKDQINLKKEKLELASKEVNASTEDWFKDYWNDTSKNKETPWTKIVNFATGVSGDDSSKLLHDYNEISTSNGTDYNDTISQLQKYYDLQKSGIALTEEQQSDMETYQETLVNIGNTLSEQTNGYVAITDEQKNWIKNINDMISLSNKFSDFDSWFKSDNAETMQNDFGTSLSDISNNDTENLNTLTNYTKDFEDEQKNAWLTATEGAESASEAIQKYEESLKGTKDQVYNLVSLPEMINKNYDSLKMLTEAQKEQSDNGNLSVETIKKLTSEYPELADEIKNTTGVYTLENSSIQKLIDAKIAVYQTDLNNAQKTAISALNASGVKVDGNNLEINSIKDLIKAKLELLRIKAIDQKYDSEVAHRNKGLFGRINSSVIDSVFNATTKQISQLEKSLNGIETTDKNLKTAQNLINNIKATVYSGNNGSSSSSDSSATPTEKVVDGIQIRLERLAETTARYKNTFDDLCNSVNGNANNISSSYGRLTSSIRSEISANQEAISRYKAELSTINLGRGWQDEIKNGSFGIYTSTYEETIKNYPIYEEYYKKLKDAQNAVIDLNDDLKDLQGTYEKAIVDVNLNPIQKQIKAEEDFVSYYKQIIDYNKQIGTDTPASLLNSEITSLNNKFAEVNKEVALYKHYFDIAHSQGSYGGKASNEWLADWISAKSELIDIQTEIDGINDSIRDLSFDTYEDVTKNLENVASNLSSLSGLINDDKMFDSDNNLTSLGLTKLGLLTSEYTNAIKSVKNYESEILTLNKLYKAGSYTQSEYKEKLAELQKDLLGATSDASSFRDSVVDVMQKINESQMDNLTSVIDKWKDALSSAKDYNDYLEQLDEKQSGVDAIKAQLAALEGIDGIEAKVKKATLEANLTESQKDLDDTIQQHAYELTTKSLEDLQTAIQDSNADYWDNLYANMDSIIDVMNSALSLTAKSSSDIVNTMNEILKTFGINKGNINYSTLTGFSTGELIKVPNGEDGIIAVKNKETVLSQKNTESLFKGINYTMPNLVNNLSSIMDKAKANNKIEMPVNIVINGNCDNNTVNKLRSTFDNDICNHILTELNKTK